MKNITTGIAKGLFAIIALTLLISSSYAQPRMHVEKPMYISPEPWAIDAISVGAFDNYYVTSVAGGMETDICVNPANPLNFVATDNRITGFFGGGVQVFYTVNGGVSWAGVTITSNQGDPAFAADSLGNFYLATLNNAVNGFVVYKSSNGGASWTSNAFLPGGGIASIDKEWIAADQTNGPFKNYVYIPFDNFSVTPAGVALMRSTNNGTSWTLVSSSLGTSTNNPGADITVDLHGKVYLAWNGPAGTLMRSSTDGGTTWGTTVTCDSHSQPGTSNGTRYVLKNNIRVNGMPHIAVDNTTGSHSGYVYDVFPTNPPGPDKADVFCATSTDGGVTFGTAVRVNDDPGTMDQFMPDVSVDNQGRVWVMFWDSRNDDPGNVLCDLYAGLSTDGGQTFTNIKVSNQTTNPNVVLIGQGDANYIGDYQSISGKTMTFPCYSGQNNSRADYTEYLPDYGMSFSKAVDSISQNGAVPNTVFIPMMGNYSGTVTYTQTVVPSPSPGTITFNWSPSNVKTLTGTPDQIVVTPVVSATVPLGQYTVTVTAAETGGPRTHQRTFNILVGNFTGINHNGIDVPQAYQLFQNYPNPFNPTTVIYYAVPKTTFVTVKVYDVLGRVVATPVNQIVTAGDHDLNFDGSNLPSGIYYYRINADGFTDVRKMILLK